MDPRHDPAPACLVLEPMSKQLVAHIVFRLCYSHPVYAWLRPILIAVVQGTGEMGCIPSVILPSGACVRVCVEGGSGLVC